MDVLILGAGMMGRAIAYDLNNFSHFQIITLCDNDKKTLATAKQFLKGTNVKTSILNVAHTDEVKKKFHGVDVAISAVPYRYNYRLATIAVETKTHFVDLGGNNDIVAQERRLHQKAKKNGVLLIPDSGLAPGLVSIITHDIVNTLDTVDSVKIRVGGVPVNPKPPLHYQIVFSPYGLINEYVEDAVVLDSGKILKKESMTEVETIKFPQPFGTMEAFLTSGGCSTLPSTYKNTITYLDYKTIRYPGHCETIKVLLDLGFADETPLCRGNQTMTPRDFLAAMLRKNIPTQGDDVVLLKVTGKGTRNGKKYCRTYTLIDYCDTVHHISAMMRTTGYPVSITAQMIENGTLKKRGVLCPEEIIPPAPFFKELKKRDISLAIHERSE